MELELTITEAVAAAKMRGGAQTKALRPLTLRLWTDGYIHNPVPGPAELARFVQPRQSVALYRSGRALLAVTESGQEPTPVVLHGQAQRLREALRGLPEAPSAGSVYADLRQSAEIGGNALDAYLEQVLREFVAAQTPYAVPKVNGARQPARSPLERQRSSRARRAVEMPESVRWALSAALLEGELAPGERIDGPALHGVVSDLLAEVCDRYGAMMRPDPDNDNDLYWSTTEERRRVWDEKRHEWEPAAPRRPWPVSSRALYKILRSPAYGWHEGRTGGVVTFVVGAVPATAD